MNETRSFLRINSGEFFLRGNRLHLKLDMQHTIKDYDDQQMRCVTAVDMDSGELVLVRDVEDVTYVVRSY